MGPRRMREAGPAWTLRELRRPGGGRGALGRRCRGRASGAGSPAGSWERPRSFATGTAWAPPTATPARGFEVGEAAVPGKRREGGALSRRSSALFSRQCRVLGLSFDP